MRKKNGFISMTLVYTFLILFMFLMLAILRTYTEKDKFLQAINDQIDNDIGVAKGSRITVVNRLLEDNMPNSDEGISYFKIANNYYGNGNGFYYMEQKSTPGYNLETITDENADGHTSRIYFFRGNVENNHIVFAHMCFRIIRTNEDGSIRVVYNGPITGTANAPKCNTIENTNYSDVIIGHSKFNTTNSVEYVKLNGSSNIPNYDENNTQSPIIPILNEWYKTHFTVTGSNTINYTEYIAKGSVFCNNKSQYQSTNYYQSRELAPSMLEGANIYDDRNISNLVTLRCSNKGDRFILSDNKLLYPVGLLTAQDVVLAGGYLDIGEEDIYNGGPSGVVTNSDFYLYANYASGSNGSFWTMSPLSNDGKVIYFRGDGEADGVLQGALATSEYGIRPVISLSSKIVIASGAGTADSPYIVRIGGSN